MLLPALLAGCQLLRTEQAATAPAGERWQGDVVLEQGQLWLHPCKDSRRFLLRATPALEQDMRELMTDLQRPLIFADLRGRMEAEGAAQGQHSLTITQLYRLQASGAQSCQTAELQQFSLQAVGFNANWTVSISPQGMLLQHAGRPPKALPYLEEQLPGDRTSFSSEINGQRIELWVAPQHCQDKTGNSLSHLGATLQINGQVQLGCAYFGSGRDH